MAYFLLGVPYILWDNIPRGTQISCPHIEQSCTSAYYADRKLGVSEMVAPPPRPSTSSPATISGRRATWPRAACTSASTSTAPTPRTGRSSTPTRSAGPKNHRGEILAALYTILLGNPQLKAARDAEGKTRFKMWWRLVGSAVEHAAKLAGQELDFQKLFIAQEEDDEEAASLADVLEILLRKWPDEFAAKDVAGMINDLDPDEDGQTLRDFLLPGARPHVLSEVRRQALKKHLDEPVRSGERTLVLRSWEDKSANMRILWCAPSPRRQRHRIYGYTGFPTALPIWSVAN